MAHAVQPQEQECIARCQSCQDICLETTNHCLELGGEHAEAEHIRTLLACAEICDTAARLMLLGSKHHGLVCEACAEVCEACADDCERFGADETMRQCIEICRRCAKSCREVAGIHA